MAKILPILKCVELINKYEFAEAVINENWNPFLIYIAVLEASK